MIKEIKYMLGNTKTGYNFGMVEIKNKLINPHLQDIPIEKEIEYYKKELSNFNLIEINKRKQFKEADIVPIYLWSKFFCVSKKFKKIFEDKLKGYWYSTNDPNYFIFLLDNFIDILDKEKSIIYYHKEFSNIKPYHYEYIENEVFKLEIVKNEYLFTIPELYGTYLSTEKFEILYRENNLTGLQFFKDLNFKRKDGSVFDAFRRKKYDEEGNCLGEKY